MCLATHQLPDACTIKGDFFTTLMFASCLLLMPNDTAMSEFTYDSDLTFVFDCIPPPPPLRASILHFGYGSVLLHHHLPN